MEDSLSIALEIGDAQLASLCLSNLSDLALNRGDVHLARELIEESIASAAARGDGVRVAIRNLTLAETLASEGAVAEARELQAQSISVLRTVDDRLRLVHALSRAGRLLLIEGSVAAASAHGSEAVAIARTGGARRAVADSVVELGFVHAWADEFADAGQLARESLGLFRELGDRPGIARCMDLFAALAFSGAAHERALRLFGAAEATRESVGRVAHPTERMRLMHWLTPLEQLLGAAECERHISEGRAMTVGHAMATIGADSMLENSCSPNVIAPELRQGSDAR